MAGKFMPPTLWSRLLQYYTPEEATKWLCSEQPLLDGAVPAVLLAEERSGPLHRLLDQLDSGVYL